MSIVTLNHHLNLSKSVRTRRHLSRLNMFERSLYGEDQVWTSLRRIGRGGGSLYGEEEGIGSLCVDHFSWTDRMTDTQDWKHNLFVTLLVGGDTIMVTSLQEQNFITMVSCVKLYELLKTIKIIRPYQKGKNVPNNSNRNKNREIRFVYTFSWKGKLN